MARYNITTLIIWGLLNSSFCWRRGCTKWSFWGCVPNSVTVVLQDGGGDMHINTHTSCFLLPPACEAVCRTERHLFPLLVSTEPTTKRYRTLMQRPSTRRINNVKTACHPKNRRPAADLKPKDGFLCSASSRLHLHDSAGSGAASSGLCLCDVSCVFMCLKCTSGCVLCYNELLLSARYFWTPAEPDPTLTAELCFPTFTVRFEV